MPYAGIAKLVDIVPAQPLQQRRAVRTPVPGLSAQKHQVNDVTLL